MRLHHALSPPAVPAFNIRHYTNSGWEIVVIRPNAQQDAGDLGCVWQPIIRHSSQEVGAQMAR